MAENSHPAVGIDLGTTFSVVAHLDADGKPVSIVNSEGDLTTPSVVMFDSSGVIVGKEAVKAARLEPNRVACFAKRDMGEKEITRPIGAEHLPPEVVQSLVLRKLKQDAELKLGPVSKVVVTVPAFFNEPRRKATQDAGRLAGLEVIDIINEPTAAAIAYGVQSGFLTEEGQAREPEKILVYDLGGGTFDVTVMAINGKDYEAVATAGDVFLGGIDWDERIVDFVAGRFQDENGVDPREDAKALQRLVQEAEDAKRALSARNEVWITFEHHDQGIRTQLTRDKFEELTADLLDRTRFTSQKVLRDAGVKWSDLTRVLLVGGSTRMPMVLQMLEKESSLKPDRSLAADEAVAHGAAIYAGMLLTLEGGQQPRVSVTNVNSHNLGVLGIEPETGRPRNRVLIPRNTRLPATHSSRFVTHKDNQATIVVPVVEGGDASGNNSTPIGKCIVKDLPSGLKKGSNVEVKFTYTESGRLTVSAELPDIEHAGATMEIDRASGLDEAALAEWEERIQSGLVIQEEAPEVAKAPVAEVPPDFGQEESDDDEVDATPEEDDGGGDGMFPAGMFAELDPDPPKPTDQAEETVPHVSEATTRSAGKRGKKKAQPPAVKSTDNDPGDSQPKDAASSDDGGQDGAGDEEPAETVQIEGIEEPARPKASTAEVKIEGVEEDEDESVDPDDDALGDFLKGLG